MNEWRPRVMKLRLILSRADWMFSLLGLILLCVASENLARYELFQHAGMASSSIAPAAIFSRTGLTERRSDALHVSGKLQVPRLGMSVLVVEGNEEEGLSVGAVHLADTTVLGGTGNAVIAGHRDTAFWPLRNLKVGDLIRLQTSRRLSYRVRAISIVEPADTSALRSSDVSELTLITCYPFRHIGSAPKRFVVRAEPAS